MGRLSIVALVILLGVACSAQTTENPLLSSYSEDYYIVNPNYEGDYYDDDFNGTEVERFVGTVHKVKDGSLFELPDFEVIVSNDTAANYIPECMPPVGALMPPDYKLSLAPRELLTPEELASAKIKTALQLSLSAYINKHDDVMDLQMMMINAGCKQEYVGEVLFLVFLAKEVRCSFLNEDNICKSTEMIERECRSRVYWSHKHRILPYFVACADQEYFDLERKRVMNRY